MPNTKNILQQSTQLAVNANLWLRDEIDNFAQSLSWVLLPALASSNSLSFRSLRKSPTEELEAIVTELERSGMSISLEARAAYRDVRVAGISLRLYAVTWPLIDKQPKNKLKLLEWTCMEKLRLVRTYG